MSAGILSLLMLKAALAQPPVVPLAQAPEGFGVGLASGSISGIALAYRPDSMHTLSGVAGWNLGLGWLRVHTDYHISYADLKVEPGADIAVRLSAGVGGFADLFGSYTQFGARVPLAFTLIPGARPFDFFIEVAPALTLVPQTQVMVQGAVGARVFFR